MYVTRELEKQIEPFIERKEVIAIVGPRQAGKTTFLQHLKKGLEKKYRVKFITFEERGDLALFQKSPLDFKELHEKYQIVIIDEFQYAKEGGQKLKYLFDTSNIKFIISGSSSLELTFQTGKYMVGRMFTFSLWPFSFREYLSYAEKELFSLIEERIPNIFSPDFNPKTHPFGEEINQRLRKQWEKYLIWGGYPAVSLAKTQVEKEKILESILENYLLKDIRSLLKLATEEELINLVKFLATQIGNLVNYKELSNVSGLPYKNLLKHLNILKQTYIIDLIKPYFTNKRTELTKNPKAYFLDSGLRNLALLDFKSFDIRNDAGSLVENYVFNSLKRRKDPFESLNFWRTKSQAEVDFVVVSGQKITPVEVRYTKTPTIGKSLYSFINKFLPKEAVILTRNQVGEERVKNCRLKFIPVYYL